MKLIDKDALVAEIERRMKLVIGMSKSGVGFTKNNPVLEFAISEYKDFLSFLDTLEVKEVDLEEKATQLSQKYFPDEENIWARPNIEAQRCKSACIEMVEWLKAQKGEEV